MNVESSWITSSLEAGLPFWFRPINMNLDKYFVDRNKLTPLHGDIYLGALSLYQAAEVPISGVAYVTKNYWGHPIQLVAFAKAPVKIRELKKPSKINPIKSFLEEVQNAGEELIESERKLMKKAILSDAANKDFSFCFKTQRPINSKIVSKFGSYRSLPNGQLYFHAGLDLRAAIGTSVYAFAEGTPVISQKLVVPGNTIIVDHGYGIYSKYFHLSELIAPVGQKIMAGDLIAKSGNTGRVEAPHLHWEISWKNIPIDPLEFIKFQDEVCKIISQTTFKN